MLGKKSNKLNKSRVLIKLLNDGIIIVFVRFKFYAYIDS